MEEERALAVNKAEEAAAEQPVKRRPGRPKGTRRVDPKDLEVIPRDTSRLNPTGRKVLSLHLRGCRTKEIAAILGLCEQPVSRVMRERRYLEAFDAKLSTVDDEFLRLKPDALRALANGLVSRDEAIGLRAAEMWFKLTGQGGYGRGEGSNPSVTAEDIALALLEAGGGTVTISAELRTQADEAERVLLKPSEENVH
jgi:hypothetical protein